MVDLIMDLVQQFRVIQVELIIVLIQDLVAVVLVEPVVHHLVLMVVMVEMVLVLVESLLHMEHQDQIIITDTLLVVAEVVLIPTVVLDLVVMVVAVEVLFNLEMEHLLAVKQILVVAAAVELMATHHPIIEDKLVDPVL